MFWYHQNQQGFNNLLFFDNDKTPYQMIKVKIQLKLFSINIIKLFKTTVQEKQQTLVHTSFFPFVIIKKRQTRGVNNKAHVH